MSSTVTNADIRELVRGIKGMNVEDIYATFEEEWANFLINLSYRKVEDLLMDDFEKLCFEGC